MPDRHPTATRLIAAALELFVANGVAGTSIVSIEAAAGLAPGSGAFYKHFRSKAELLDAAIEDAEETSAWGTGLFEAFGQIEGIGLLEEARYIGRGTWFAFDAHRDLALVMVRERDRPPRYTHEAGGWPGDGAAFLTAWLEAKAAAGELAVTDPRATAVVLLDALFQFWLQRTAETDTPYGVDAEGFLNAWVALIAGLQPS